MFLVKLALLIIFIRLNFARHTFLDTLLCPATFWGQFFCPPHKKCGHLWAKRFAPQNPTPTISCLCQFLIDRLPRPGPEFGHPALRGGDRGRPVFPGEEGRTLRRTIDKELKVKTRIHKRELITLFAKKTISFVKIIVNFHINFFVL